LELERGDCLRRIVDLEVEVTALQEVSRRTTDYVPEGSSWS
jgi:hypothetical protein